ncbi:hypothetical protein Tco_0947240 [Tanacetum coccineum]
MLPTTSSSRGGDCLHAPIHSSLSNVLVGELWVHFRPVEERFDRDAVNELKFGKKFILRQQIYVADLDEFAWSLENGPTSKAHALP